MSVASGDIVANAIRIDALNVVTKEFTLDVADWSAAPGACVAIIGPNGAGKSTLLETLLGLRKVERLEGSMLGVELRRWRNHPELRQKLGVLLQRTQLPYGLRVQDVVKLHEGLYQRTSRDIQESLGINELGKKRYDQLSSGQMQRTELFMALAHEPDLLFMDEPLNALDHRYAASVCEVVAQMRNTTVMMASHRASELALADVALWVQGGRVLAAKHPDTLRQELLGDFRLNVVFESDETAQQFSTRLKAATTPRYLKVVNARELRVFGDEALVRLARDLVQDVSTAKLEFGRTDLSDLLYRCAQVAPNA